MVYTSTHTTHIHSYGFWFTLEFKAMITLNCCLNSISYSMCMCVYCLVSSSRFDSIRFDLIVVMDACLLNFLCWQFVFTNFVKCKFYQSSECSLFVFARKWTTTTAIICLVNATMIVVSKPIDFLLNRMAFFLFRVCSSTNGVVVKLLIHLLISRFHGVKTTVLKNTFTHKQLFLIFSTFFSFPN